MQTLQFKTNINCGGCLAKIAPAMKSETKIQHWTVDTNNPNKILTVETDQLTESEVIDSIRRAGFKAEPLK